MIAHTPGPWCVEANADVGYDIRGGMDTLVVGAQGVERMADARLIAAAPELFAALEDALSIFEFGEDDKTVVAPKWAARAHAAIAKAEGKT